MRKSIVRPVSIVLATVILGCLIWSACNGNGGEAGGDNGTSSAPPGPKPISYSIVKTYPHATTSYTQGFIVYNGELFEGTGLEGKSRLMKVDLASGKALQ